jgi:hypothetical protein
VDAIFGVEGNLCRQAQALVLPEEKKNKQNGGQGNALEHSYPFSDP